MALPLVSLLISAHERPDCLRLALQSAQAQTYPNLEILISDCTVGAISVELVHQLVVGDPRVRYIHCSDMNLCLESWLNPLSVVQGSYVGFLTENSQYHPQKVERMVSIYERYPDVGLVTSHCDLIESENLQAAQLVDAAPLFAADAAMHGDEMSIQIILKGVNLIGDPSTVLLRRADLGASFGVCQGRQYKLLSDVATWVQIMRGRRVVWLQDSLAYRRVPTRTELGHKLQSLWADLEWLQLLIDTDAAGWFEVQDAEVRASLKVKLDSIVPKITEHAQLLRDGPYHAESFQRLLRQAFDRLLH